MFRKLVRVAGGVAVRCKRGPGAVGEAGVPAVGVFVAAGPGAAFGKIVAEVGIDGPVRVEGGGGQTVLVHEIGDGELAPREACAAWLRHLGGADDDTVAVDLRLGRLEDAIAAGEFEQRFHRAGGIDPVPAHFTREKHRLGAPHRVGEGVAGEPVHAERERVVLWEDPFGARRGRDAGIQRFGQSNHLRARAW